MENLGKSLIGLISVAFQMPMFSKFGKKFSGFFRDLIEKLFFSEERDLYLANLKRVLKKQDPQWQANHMSLDCSPAFVPTTFIGSGWDFGKGDADRDPRAPVEMFDFSTVLLETFLGPKETYIKGEEKLRRHRQIKSLVPLGANALQALWFDYKVKGQNSILESLFMEKAVSWIEFYGDILQDFSNNRYTLCLSRNESGIWRCYNHDIDSNRNTSNYSAVSVAS